jgi:uncharacterized protein YmfQ (DUF2313 family)
MSDVSDKMLSLARQLYPGGRAFNMPEKSYLEMLHFALGLSEERAYNDATSILFDILPDNANFTLDDATDWERRLGLITNVSVPLASRMLLIKKKLNQPGINPAKGSYLYLQEQLNLAGFTVTVYENRFANYPSGFTTLTPEQLTGLNIFKNYTQYGDFRFGQREYGGKYNNMIVNNIDESKDLLFNFVGDWKNTFYIGGPTPGSFANVPLIQKDQFRQLILKTKQVQTIGFLLINYT